MLKTVAILLTTVFVILALSKSLYSHTHKTDNGLLVAHSHPYNKSTDSEPVKHHHHSQNFLLVLTLFDEGTYFLFILIIPAFLFSIPILFKPNTLNILFESLILSPDPRGPPFFFKHS